MAVSTRIVLEGDQEFIDALDRITSRRVRRRALEEGAFRIAKNAAEEQIIRGGRFRGRGGLSDAPAHPSRLTSRTGRLRSSLAPTRAVDRSGLPRYIDVGTSVEYAAAHELGLSVTHSVPEHTRRSAFGRPTQPYRVRAHQRRVTYKKRPFLEPAARIVARQLPAIFRREMEREAARRVT